MPCPYQLFEGSCSFNFITSFRRDETNQPVSKSYIDWSFLEIPDYHNFDVTFYNSQLLNRNFNAFRQPDRNTLAKELKHLNTLFFHTLQTLHVDSTLKRRGNGRFHVVSTWNPRGVFVGLRLGWVGGAFLMTIFLNYIGPLISLIFTYV